MTDETDRPSITPRGGIRVEPRSDEPTAPSPRVDEEEAAAPEEDVIELTQPLQDFAAVDDGDEDSERLSLLGVEERPASAHLKETDLTADWVARAEWFEQQAEKDVDHKSRARTLVVASELWAMAGNLEHARRIAEHAAKLSPAIALRQARQLAAQLGDHTATCSALTTEGLSSTSPAAKAHAAFACAEVARLKLKDTSASLRHFEQGARHAPSDPRPTLFKLAKQLGGSSRPPSLRIAEGEELDPLREATQLLVAMRGQTPAKDAPPGSPLGAFVVARAALEEGKRGAAAEALLQLAEVPEFSRAARWLASSLLAQEQNTRQQSADLLSELLNERANAALRRVLAGRALELGDNEAAQLSLLQDQVDDDADLAFTSTDHVAIGALCGAPEQLLGSWLDAAEKQDELKPLVWSVVSALKLDRQAAPLNDSDDALLLGLGSLLGKPERLPEFEARVAAVDTASSHPALLRLMRLEGALNRGDGETLARALVEGLSADSAERQSQAQFAAGLIRERSGEEEAADEHYGRALRSTYFGEAAARALLARLPRQRASKLLETLADSSKDAERKALLLLEAALVSEDGSTAAALCQRALDTDPAAPWATVLGERFAGTPGEATAWVKRQLEQVDSDWDRAILHMRQSLYATDPATRAGALADAWQAWPRDAALASLLEHATPQDAHTRARMREQLVALDEDSSAQAQLLLEAAWLYEACGGAEQAARCAEKAAARQPLAHHCLYRTAARHPQALLVKRQLQEQLSTATQPNHRADLCLRLAELERRDGHADACLKWLAEAVSHAPTHLPALAELERAAMNNADATHLLSAMTRLASLLPAQDALAPALLSARLERLENGWSAAYPHLRLAARASHTSSFVARQLLSHARAIADYPMALSMTLLLASRATQPLDQAILLLRAAEVTVQIGKGAEALDILRTALDIHPTYLPALELYAQILTDGEQWARAAEAHEGMGGRSRVVVHQVAHWYEAANLWIDKVDDRERGLLCLERASNLDPTADGVFERLKTFYEQSGDFDKLQRAVERRLSSTRDREELARLQLVKAQVLIASGDTRGAREALLAVIRNSPENVEGLTSLADLAERDGDALSAEHALLQLVRLNADPRVQADVYARLATLYQGALQNPKRALRCYQEVLRRRPEDEEAFDAMLSVYVDAGQTARALELLEKRQSGAETDTEQVELALRTADLMALDPAYTAQTEQAYADLLKRWPTAPNVIDAVARYYVNTDREQFVADWAARLLKQLRDDASKQKFDPEPMGLLAVLADVLEDKPMAGVVAAARSFLEGDPKPFPGAGGAAMSRHLDAQLAPSGVSNALRILLVQTRGLLDQALELNLGPLAPKRVVNDRVTLAFEHKARSMGMSVPELFVTTVEPTLSLVTGNPSRIVLGSYWIDDAPKGALDFLAWRCLKSDQARVGLFTQLDKNRLYTVLLAFLSCFVEIRQPAPDRDLFATTRRRVLQRLPRTIDDDMPVLALEVLTQLREAEPDLSDAVCRWVNRSALLASGDLEAALFALEVLEEGSPVIREGRSPESFLVAPQSRDLFLYMHSDAFLSALRTARE